MMQTKVKQVSKRALLSVFILNLILVSTLWLKLGSGYTPINDGWFPATTFDYSYDRDETVERNRPKNVIPFHRAVRRLPYAVNGLFDTEGFPILNAILFSINVFSGFGLFLILLCFFPEKPLFSLVASLFFMYFPIGGTLFWFGAMGVNFGFLLCIYSTCFFFISLQRNSIPLFVVSLILLVACHRTYQGYIPIQAIVCMMFLIINRERIKVWFVKTAIFASAGFAGIIPSILNSTTGGGREGRLVDFNLWNIIDGFKSASYNVFIESFITIYNSIGFGTSSVLLISVVCFLLFWFVFKDKNVGQSNLENSESLGFRSFTYILIASLVLFIAGYFPFSLTEIRFGTDRQLLFARVSIVLLTVWVLFWLTFTLIKNKTIAGLSLSLICSLLIGTSMNAKLNIAESYSNASKMMRIFLGDLAIALTKENSNPENIVVYIKKSFVANKKLKVLINRPRYPVRYLMQDDSVQVLSFTQWYTARGYFTYDSDVLTLNTREISLLNTLFLSYSIETGFIPYPSLETLLQNSPEMMAESLPSTNSQGLKYSERENWFVKERNRLLNVTNLEHDE